MGVKKKFEYSIVTPGTRAYRDYLALRHKVFCEELKRIPSLDQFFSDVPLESDAYDAHSLHVLCRSLETGAAVGCSRMILPSVKGLSIASRYPISHQTTISPSQIGEISRLAIASELRRYRGDLSSAGLPETHSNQLRSASAIDKRDGSLVAMGLYRENFKLAHKYGITHFYAAMEPSLARLLARNGFPFQIAGPLNTMVKPARQPYFIGVHAIQAAMPDSDAYLSQLVSAPAKDTLALTLRVSQANWMPSTLQAGQSERSGQYPAFSQ